MSARGIFRFAALRATLCALLLFPFAAQAETLKLATWNLDWLSLRPAGDPGLPADRQARGDADYAALQRYALFLNADVVAFQEVEDVAAAQKVFPPDRYDVVTADGRALQKVGFAIRHGLRWHRDPDVTGLDLFPHAMHPLRDGAAITIETASGPLSLLTVHLKSGCWAAPLNSHHRACEELAEQAVPLADWITARQVAHTPYIVLGDLNRRLDQHPGETDDSFLAALHLPPPWRRATEGRASPCWGGESFIDHILAGGDAAAWLQADSLHVLVYRETDPALKDHLSDHCPVSALFKLPDPSEVR